MPSSKLLLVIGLLLLDSLQISAVQAQSNTDWTEARYISRTTEYCWSPVLTADRSGNIHAFWSSRSVDQETEPRALVYSRQVGGAWSIPNEIIMSPNGQDARFPRAQVDDAGRLHVIWSTQGPTGELYHSSAPVQNALSAQNWQLPNKISNADDQSDLQLDSTGNLHVVFSNVSEDKGICHMISRDSGVNWIGPNCIPRTYSIRPDEHEVRPRMAIDSRDRLHVVWVLDDYSPLSQLRYSGRAVYYARSEDEGATWSDALEIDAVDGRVDSYDEAIAGLQPEWGNIVVDGDDRLHVVWVGNPDMYRYHQWSEDGGITWTPRQVAIPVGGYNQWQGLTVDHAGVVHLIWPSLGRTYYARLIDGSWSLPVDLDTPGHTHSADAVVALGNRLHVVMQDHGGMPREHFNSRGGILHMARVTQAKGLSPQPLPALHLSTLIEDKLEASSEARFEYRAVGARNPDIGQPLVVEDSLPEPSSSTDQMRAPILIGMLLPLILTSLTLVLKAVVMATHCRH